MHCAKEADSLVLLCGGFRVHKWQVQKGPHDGMQLLVPFLGDGLLREGEGGLIVGEHARRSTKDVSAKLVQEDGGRERSSRCCCQRATDAVLVARKQLDIGAEFGTSVEVGVWACLPYLVIDEGSASVPKLEGLWLDWLAGHKAAKPKRQDPALKLHLTLSAEGQASCTRLPIINAVLLGD